MERALMEHDCVRSGRTRGTSLLSWADTILCREPCLTAGKP